MRVKDYAPVDQAKTKKAVLGQGLNESKDYGSMSPGELIYCDNYTMLDSTFTGCTSPPGFEVFDGKMRDATNPVDGSTISVDKASDVPITWNQDHTSAVDTERETLRAAIEPLSTSKEILGYFELYDEVYCFVIDRAAMKLEVYSFDETDGLKKLTDVSIPAGTDLSDDRIFYDSQSGRLSFFPASSPNSEIVALWTGISPLYLAYLDGSGALALHEITSTNFPAVNEVTHADFFDNRLFLFFREGQGYHSDVGDPDQYDPSVSTAGAWNFGSEVTDTLVFHSAMVIGMTRGADIIRLTDPDLKTGIDMVKEPFSTKINVIRGTMEDYYGAGLFCGEKGIGLLEAAADSGTFNNTPLTRRIQKTYSENYKDILRCNVNRITNQYEIYFKSGKVILLTLDTGKRVKSVGMFDYKRSISSIFQKKDENMKYLSFSSDQHAYIQHEDCTSFNDGPITTELVTAFSSFGLDNVYKQLVSLVINHSSEGGQQYEVQAVFDYGSPDSKISIPLNTEPVRVSDRYEYSNWDHRVYGGEGVVNDTPCPIYGMGRTISIRIKTSSMYHRRHTIHSLLFMMYRCGLQF